VRNSGKEEVVVTLLRHWLEEEGLRRGSSELLKIKKESGTARVNRFQATSV
jgi:hypothetical protein